jgi:hypothetical protein
VPAPERIDQNFVAKNHKIWKALELNDNYWGKVALSTVPKSYSIALDPNGRHAKAGAQSLVLPAEEQGCETGLLQAEK